MTIAHIGGIPIEEMLPSLSPALLVTFAAASATLRARPHRGRLGMRPRTRQRKPPGPARPNRKTR